MRSLSFLYEATDTLSPILPPEQVPSVANTATDNDKKSSRTSMPRERNKEVVLTEITLEGILAEETRLEKQREARRTMGASEAERSKWVAARDTGTSEASSTWQRISPEALDLTILRLYNAMRDECKVEPDQPLVSTLNRMFQLFLAPTTSSYVSLPPGVLRSSSTSGFPASSPNPNVILSHTTARTIFEDLVCLGSNPHDITAILKACRFTARQEKDLLSNHKGILEKNAQE